MIYNQIIKIKRGGNLKSKLLKLNTTDFVRKFSTTSILRANISTGNTPFQLFEWNLNRIEAEIEKFNLLNKERKDIIASGMTIEIWDQNDRLHDINAELSITRNYIILELGIANKFYDQIKLTHPNFESDRLLEYNNFCVLNKLNY